MRPDSHRGDRNDLDSHLIALFARLIRDRRLKAPSRTRAATVVGFGELVGPFGGGGEHDPAADLAGDADPDNRMVCRCRAENHGTFSAPMEVWGSRIRIGRLLGSSAYLTVRRWIRGALESQIRGTKVRRLVAQ